ncbi:MAG: hypothetical protein JWL99_4445 [Streptomyces oryziradicis]|nr:hypothetical protein [Actinacidiphila oryziradicis]
MYELTKEALNACLRRNRRPPQAVAGRCGRGGRRGACQPQRTQWGRHGARRDRGSADRRAGRLRGRLRLGLAGGAAGGLRLRAPPGAPAALQGHRLRPAEERQGRRGHPRPTAARGPSPEAWIAPLQIRQQRSLLRHRCQLVRLRTLLRNRVHAVLADHGCDRPGSYFTAPGRVWLDTLDLPDASRRVVETSSASPTPSKTPSTLWTSNCSHTRAVIRGSRPSPSCPASVRSPPSSSRPRSATSPASPPPANSPPGRD